MDLPTLTALLPNPTRHSMPQPLPLKSPYRENSATVTRAQQRFTRSRDLRRRSLKTKGLAMPLKKALLNLWRMVTALKSGKPPLTHSSTPSVSHGLHRFGLRLFTERKRPFHSEAHSSPGCKASKPTSPSGNTAPSSTSAPGQATAPLMEKSFSLPTASSGRHSGFAAAVPLSCSARRKRSAEALQSLIPSLRRCAPTCRMPSSLATRWAAITTGFRNSSGG